MYAKRNSLTILAILVLITTSGYFWYRSEAKDLERSTAKNKQLTVQLRGALEVVETLASVTGERDSLQTKWQNSPKKLLNAEEPAFSLAYINWLISEHQLDLDFDFYLNEKKARKEFTAFSYTLSGEGDYRNICALIWHMTRSPLLYQIKSVSYRRSEKEARLLNFSIMFEGYSMNKDWEVNSELTMISQRLDWEAEFGYDAFASLRPIVEPVVVERAVAAPPPKPKEPPGLVDVENATLVGISSEKVYVRARDGKVVTLRVGDQVRRGRMARIDQPQNLAEFLLETEFGTRLVQLKLEYN